MSRNNAREISHILFGCSFVLFCATTASVSAQEQAISVPRVTISVIRESEIPARDAGTLQSLECSEGAEVSAGTIVAVLENNEQTLAVEAARLAAQIAAMRAEDELPLLAAMTQVKEIEADRVATEVALKIAQTAAKGDSLVSIATAETRLRQLELDRALKSQESFKGSISESQIDRLKTSVAKGQLEIEQAKDDLKVVRMRPELEQATLNKKDQEIKRFESVIAQERRNIEVAKIGQEVRANELQMASLKLEQRNIRAPFDGFIMKLDRQVGEWVEPGTPIARIIDVRSLRAEGFLPAAQAAKSLQGRDVLISVNSGSRVIELAGKVVFVSLEVDPQNQQVRFFAEFVNKDLAVRPGMTGSLHIKR